MKRIIILILCALVLFTGCVGNTAPVLTGSIVSQEDIPAETPPAKETPSPSPTYPPDELTAEDGQYMLAWLTDTQYYSRSFPEIYYALSQFLIDDGERMNLKYVMHTGDLINNCDDEAQWAVADKAQAMIDGIPNGVLAGNHDVAHEKANYSYFSKLFGEARYAGKPWYGGSFEDNRGHFDLIDAGSSRYIFIYMGYTQTSAGIKWINETLAAYPDRVGILLLHDYLTTEGELSEDGKLLYKKVVSKNSNLRFVLCGHRYTLNNLEYAFDDDGDGEKERRVDVVMGNYQAAGEMGGSGFMRFFKADEADKKLYMYSYSPYLKEYVYFDEPERQEEKYAAPMERETLVFDMDWL